MYKQSLGYGLSIAKGTVDIAERSRKGVKLVILGLDFLFSLF